MCLEPDTTMLAAGIGGAVVSVLIFAFITGVTIAIISKKQHKNPRPIAK